MKNYLIAGSFAYDTILVHPDKFHEKILPESLERLNVSYFMNSLDDEFGGTAGNIAYNATLFKQDPVLVGTLGKDGARYVEYLKEKGLNAETLTIYEKEKTPHCFLMTDTLNNQIMGFYLGSMRYEPMIPKETPELWHICAENGINFANTVKQAINQKKSYFFDPGQALPYLSSDEINKIVSLEKTLENATGTFVNEYEAELLSKALNKNVENLVTKENQFLIRTLGSKGVDLITKNGLQHFGVAKTNKIVDPTGCGDAFRAGFLYGYTNGLDLDICTKLGATMGSFAIENSGGQNHHPTLEEINQRMMESYNYVTV